MPKLAAACVYLSGLAIALYGGEAPAQSTSTCIAMGSNMVHCDTMDMGPPSSQPGYDGGASLGRGIGLMIARARENAFQKRVGKLLADGDCQGAARLALESGRLQLGESIAATCQANSVQVDSAPLK